MKLLAKWLLSACALLFVAYIYGGVQVQSFPSALLGSLIYSVLGLVIESALGGLFSKQ